MAKKEEKTGTTRSPLQKKKKTKGDSFQPGLMFRMKQELARGREIALSVPLRHGGDEESGDERGGGD